jgi:phosphoribosyl-ATP pyrophosphohydrolase
VIIPSIDLMNGHAVQLVGGKELALDAGDPRPIAEKLGLAGEIAVIDLDAALGRGSNEATIRDLLGRARCRVGGGIRDAARALQWLDAGAAKVILGTRAVPEVLRELPRERVIAALDAEHGEIVVEGWRTRTGHRVIDKIGELRDLAGGFLVTFVEREGRLGGTALDRADGIVKAAGDARVTIAGGVTTAGEIAALDRVGADAQVGMAIYTGRLSIADAFAAPLGGDRWPAVLAGPDGAAAAFEWMDRPTLAEAFESRTFSRIDLDHRRASLRLTMRAAPRATAWGESWGVAELSRRLLERANAAPEGSYTRRLLDDPELLRAKLREEASELADAKTPGEVTHEAADVLYFTLVAAARAGITLHEIGEVLDRRALKVHRRPGDAKPPHTGTTGT